MRSSPRFRQHGPRVGRQPRQARGRVRGTAGQPQPYGAETACIAGQRMIRGQHTDRLLRQAHSALALAAQHRVLYAAWRRHRAAISASALLLALAALGGLLVHLLVPARPGRGLCTGGRARPAWLGEDRRYWRAGGMRLFCVCPDASVRVRRGLGFPVQFGGQRRHPRRRPAGYGSRPSSARATSDQQAFTQRDQVSALYLEG
jgi:hypothetical protein